MFIVMTAAQRMPSSCWGRYRRVAVVELTPEFVEQGLTPRMISERAHGVARLVRTWERLSVGKTDQCAYGFAKAEADALCAQLNGERHDIAA